jgi:hypothetical protein
VEYYRHLQQKIAKINGKTTGKVIALELHAAPLAGNANVEQATDAFARSLKELPAGTGPAMVLEHCDAMTGPRRAKAFCR